MSEQTPDVEQAPAIEGTPDAAQQPTQAEVDWAKRYSDLQPEYTRATQESARLREQVQAYQTLLNTDDPDTRLQAAQALGIELADDEYEDTQSAADPYLTREEWAQFQQQQRDAQKAEQAAVQEQQQLEAIGNYIDAQMDALGVDDADRDWIFQKAALGDGTRLPDGTVVPDVEAAIDAMRTRDLEAQKRWAKTKRTQQFSPGGGEGTHTLGVDAKHGDRVQFMLQRLAEQE